MSINNITHLFKEVPLYKKEVFQYYKKEGNRVIVDFDVLNSLYEYLNVGNKENLITKCVYCGFEELVFNQNSYYDDNDFTKTNLLLFKANFANATKYIYFGNDFSNYNQPAYTYVGEDEFKMAILRYVFICSNDANHIYFMNILLIKHDGLMEVTKIGQYPESTVLASNKLNKKYEKILKKISAFDDFKNANKSKQYSLDVGAYDYERRILEKIVNFYLKSHNRDDLINKVCPFEIKYDVIKNDFDPSIRQLVMPLYSALSGGVHFMTDQECSTYFNDLSNLINIQLQYMLINDERDDSIASSAEALRQLNTKYGKKQ